MIKKFRNVFEVADLCRVHPETVRRWIRDGRLEAFYAGRRQVISEEALEKFLQRVPTGAER